MGSQQLLLIVLGVILVALVIFSGVQFVGDYFQNLHREKLQSDIQYFHNQALEYKKKAVEFGGGSGSFEGWNIPQSSLNKLDYKLQFAIQNDAVSYLAEGSVSGWDSEKNVKIWVKYNKSGKTIRYLN